MNRYAVFHRPESCFAYPVAGDRLRVVLRVSAQDELDKVELLYNNKYDYEKIRYVPNGPLRYGWGFCLLYGGNNAS